MAEEEKRVRRRTDDGNIGEMDEGIKKDQRRCEGILSS